jgi:hypothetical protein
MEPASTVLVRNHRARVHNIGLARRTKGKNTQGQETVVQMEHVEIVLLPGWNPVDGKLWAEAKENAIVAIHLRDGDLEEKPLSPEEIKSLADGDAERLVLDCWNEDLLKRMRNCESRPPIISCINAQLAKLEPSAESLAVKAKADAARAGKKI